MLLHNPLQSWPVIYSSILCWWMLGLYPLFCYYEQHHNGQPCTHLMSTCITEWKGSVPRKDPFVEEEFWSIWPAFCLLRLNHLTRLTSIGKIPIFLTIQFSSSLPLLFSLLPLFFSFLLFPSPFPFPFFLPCHLKHADNLAAQGSD